jgi:hypothetical protein
MDDPNLVQETRGVEGFDSISLRGFGSVRIEQGDSEALTIEAPEDVMPRVTSEIKDGTLILGLEKGGWLEGLRRKKMSIRFSVPMKRIKGITLSGVGDIDAPSVTTEALSVVVSGAGNVAIDSLTAEVLDVTLSGAGSCKIAGRTDTQTIRVSGAGSYAGPDLESSAASVDVSGAGDVTIHVRDTLDAKVSGTGSIRYYGGPTVRQRVTGVGSIECFCKE